MVWLFVSCFNEVPEQIASDKKGLSKDDHAILRYIFLPLHLKPQVWAAKLLMRKFTNTECFGYRKKNEIKRKKKLCLLGESYSDFAFFKQGANSTKVVGFILYGPFT